MKYTGNLVINTKSDAKKYADVSEVTGNLSINSDAKLDALTSVGGYLYINSDTKLDAPELYAKGFGNFRVYDYIACVVLSEKEKGEIKILSCRQARIKKGTLIGEKFFIAKKGELTAHAADIKNALEELSFKTGERNVEQYKDMPVDTIKTPTEWAFIYRMITGACAYGIDQFMKSKGKLKKKYTLAEIIDETRGAFGHDVFTKIVAPMDGR